jgi:N-acetylglutamate synthase-like GNAT family acetyltransferase
MLIRAAEVKERAALEALQWRASLEHEIYREVLRANPDAIEVKEEPIAAGQVWVAEVDGAVVGFAGIEMRADGDADLDSLFVEPSLWRKGAGRALVERCAEEARARGAHALLVIANPTALGFYSACGFVEVGRAATRFDTAPVMRRETGGDRG